MPDRILLLGDTHANLAWTRHAIKHAHDLGADLVLQLGDFGFWPRRSAGRGFLAGVEEALAEAALLVDANGHPLEEPAAPAAD